MRVAILSAPSHLGLRPPVATATPGCAKAPEALREAGLHSRLLDLGARDAGVVLAGRYLDDHLPESGRLRNQEAILEHSDRLGSRLLWLLRGGEAPLLLGGDCSLLLGVGRGLSRQGRFGLVHIDGHTDFRHPGNSEACGSLAGEDLAAAVGRHWPPIARPDGRQHFDPRDVAQVGCRDDDPYLDEVRATLALVVPASAVPGRAPAIAEAVAAVVDRAGLDGYWMHLDVDALDPALMPAVDSPAPGGLTFPDLTQLLSGLAPRASGADVTIFDPDLDPGGVHASELAECLVAGLARLGASVRSG